FDRRGAQAEGVAISRGHINGHVSQVGAEVLAHGLRPGSNRVPGDGWWPTARGAADFSQARHEGRHGTYRATGEENPVGALRGEPLDARTATSYRQRQAQSSARWSTTMRFGGHGARGVQCRGGRYPGQAGIADLDLARAGNGL